MVLKYSLNHECQKRFVTHTIIGACYKILVGKVKEKLAQIHPLPCWSG